MILTVLGAGGVIVTGVLAAKETSKALRLLEQAKQEKGAELTKLEIVVNAAPAYLPAVATGASTIICIFGANALNKKKQASLVSAYNILSNYQKNYRQSLIDLKGEEVDKEVRQHMVRRYYDYHEIDVNCPDQKVVWYEDNSGASIIRYEREILDAEYHFNRNFTMRGYAYLNEWYDFLGLPHTDDGDVLGWTMEDEIYWVDFEHYPVEKDGKISAYCITSMQIPGILDSEEYEL